MSDLASITTITGNTVSLREEGGGPAIRAYSADGDFLLGVSALYAGDNAFREFAHAILAALPEDEEPRYTLHTDPAGDPYIEDARSAVVAPYFAHALQKAEQDVEALNRGEDPGLHWMPRPLFDLAFRETGTGTAEAKPEPRFYPGTSPEGYPAIFDRENPDLFADLPKGEDDLAREGADRLNAGEEIGFFWARMEEGKAVTVGPLFGEVEQGAGCSCWDADEEPRFYVDNSEGRWVLRDRERPSVETIRYATIEEARRSADALNEGRTRATAYVWIERPRYVLVVDYHPEKRSKDLYGVRDRAKGEVDWIGARGEAEIALDRLRKRGSEEANPPGAWESERWTDFEEVEA